jgi:hypothetical protein
MKIFYKIFKTTNKQKNIIYIYKMITDYLIIYKKFIIIYLCINFLKLFKAKSKKTFTYKLYNSFLYIIIS